MTAAVVGDRSALWLPLLRRLTSTLPRWTIWKNADAALSGSGDIDSAAPETEWNEILAEFRGWARQRELGPVTACRHVRGVLFLLAPDRQHSTFVELDVNAKKYFRGWTLFRSDDLLPLSEIDARGFRRVRPGTEAVILLLGNGTRWGGRPNREGLQRKKVREMLMRDLPGAEETAARLFGSAADALVRVIEHVVRGEWDRRSLLQLEASALARSMAEPQVLMGRLWSRPVKQLCPVLRTIFTDHRRMPADLDAWLERVRRSHSVLE